MSRESDASKLTFAELGIPFPLFDAPVVEVDRYHSKGFCSICEKQRPHVFDLGIGCAIMIRCGKCDVENALRANERVDLESRGCGTTVPFPPVCSSDCKTCYECLRAGRAAMTKDTELGMISFEQAFNGVTGGVPGLKNPDFELVQVDDGWFAARLPQSMMFELLRTPDYATWQGGLWRFCCKQPMVYAGSWQVEEFNSNAPDGDGRTLFEQIVEDIDHEIWDTNSIDICSYYVFRCRKCGNLKSHWDSD